MVDLMKPGSVLVDLAAEAGARLGAGRGACFDVIWVLVGV